MKGTVLAITAALLLIGSTLSAQKTVYQDKRSQWTTDKEKAVEYAVITEERKKQVKVEFYTLDGRLKGVGNYSKYTEKPRERVRNGLSTYLYTNGKDSVVSNYKENRLMGQKTVYYPDGTPQRITTYKEGRMEGKLVGYYPDGKLRREEMYETGKCTGGKLLAEDGSELPFEPYEVMPEFPGGPKELLSALNQFIKYPKEAAARKLQGRVIIQFFIDKDGRMVNPTVVQSVDPLLDQAAINTIEAMALMYKWTPGKQDGKPKRVKYTIPVAFRIPLTN